MVIIKDKHKHKPMCATHKPITVGYIQGQEDAEKRMKKGQKQTQCPKCLYWFWKEEIK